MMTCKLPFNGENEDVLLDNMMTNTKDFSEYEWTSQISESVMDLIEKMLRASGKKRI